MKVPKIESLKAAGMSILVELINPEEILDTKLEIISTGTLGKVDNSLIDGASQAYILDIGPKVDTEEWGFNAGDRIMFSGNFVPAYNYDKHLRARGTIDPHSIKAVLNEK
jgi:hypothetical protein